MLARQKDFYFRPHLLSLGYDKSTIKTPLPYYVGVNEAIG